MAAWFGLLCGIGHVLIWVLVHGIGCRNCASLVLEMLWAVPLITVILFAVAGWGMVMAGSVLPRMREEWLAVAVFAFLTVYGWLRVNFLFYIADYAMITLAVGLTVAFLRGARRHAWLRFWRRNWPRSFTWAAVLLILASVVAEIGARLQERAATAGLPPPAAGSPNLLVIVVDTLRADHLSVYGYGRPTSPNLDRIARQGIVFENAFATSSWTLPSHASMLTGLYPHEHGGEFETLPTQRQTMGDALMTRGYRTGAFSANRINFSRVTGFGQGFIHFEDYSVTIGDMMLLTPYARGLERVLGLLDAPELWTRKRAPDVNRAVLHWIDLDRKRPFFAFLNYYDVHMPYLSPYRSKFSKGKRPEGLLKSVLGGIGSLKSPAEVKGEVDAYDGGVAYADDYIARLLAELDKRGWSENTIVVITSDHGEGFGEHGFFSHGNSLYREEIRVPLIFWGPKWFPAGVRVAQPVTNAALPATLIDLAGAGDPSMFPIASLTKLWRGSPASLEYPEPLAELAQLSWSAAPHYGWAKTLVNSQWQYIIHEKFGPQLYRWPTDPSQSQNLATTPEGQVIAQEFAQRLQWRLAPRGPAK